MRDATLPHYRRPYTRLAVMLLANAALMFLLMYAMVNVLHNVVLNLNHLYMVLLMSAPMVAIEILIMRPMYPNARANLLLIAGSIALSLLALLGIRTQAFVDDRQLLESMIPHHAGAILMCEQASITDEQIAQLCANIEGSQQADIEWMRLKLESLD